MILTCPSCAGRFLVNDAAFGTQPRTVRCGKCAMQWQADPPPPAEAPAASPHTPEASATPAHPDSASASTRPPQTDFAAALRSSAAGAPGPKLPVVAPEKTSLFVKLWGRIRWRFTVLPASIRQGLRIIGLLLFIGIAGFGGRHLLDRIGLHFSLSQRAIAGAGLTIQNVRSEQKSDDGIERLVVDGMISNDTDHSIDIPPLTVTGRDRRGDSRGNWPVTVKDKKLAAGDITTFQATIDKPDRNIVDVVVTFADK